MNDRSLVTTRAGIRIGCRYVPPRRPGPVESAVPTLQRHGLLARFAHLLNFNWIKS